jgi:RNA polymerase sigma-70 factor (ECF subfamily)
VAIIEEREEIDLLNRARALDQEALALIHDTYFTPVYRYVSFRVADRHTAEDLASEVFSRFLGALHERSAPPNTIRGWLFGAAANVVKEHYRRQRRTAVTPIPESLVNDEKSMEQRLDERIEKEQLRQAMGELTEEQQHVLALRFGHGLSVRDVADTVNKSEAAVKMLQARAIASLTRRLAGTLANAEVGL